MSELHVLSNKRPRDEELIAEIRTLLAEAEAGELIAVGLVVERVDGSCHKYGYHDAGSNAYRFVGMLQTLQQHAIARYLSDEASHGHLVE